MTHRCAPRQVEEEAPAQTAKHVFQNAHQYHINSISMNSDSETFLSADDLRINVWHLERSSECFSACRARAPALGLPEADETRAQTTSTSSRRTWRT